MSTPPKSLNARVPWLSLLSQLEVVVPSPVLPAVFLRCPLCGHSRLTIMEDYLAEGETFHCRNCNESGDMIELAAKAWGLSIKATIIKLTRRGFDLPIDDATIHGYLAEHVEYRKRLSRLWQESQSYLSRPSYDAPLVFVYICGLPDEFSAKRWRRRAGEDPGWKLSACTSKKRFCQEAWCVSGTSKRLAAAAHGGFSEAAAGGMC